MPLFPRRFLRFMAKKELFWPPLGWIVRAGGGFRVDRGKRDQQAIDTAVALCREGHAVVMFPEGTRRAKGLRKRYEARWHTGAARIALEAGVPLVPAGIVGNRAARPARPAARRLRAADRDRRPRRARRRRGGAARDRPAARGDHRPRGRRGRVDVTPARRSGATEATPRRALLVIDGDSFAHRAFHALPALDPTRERPPGEPAHRPHVDGAPALAGGAAARGVRRLGHAHRADLPARAARRLPGGPRVRPGAARAARPRAGPARGGRHRLREGMPGFEADDFLAAAVAVGAGRRRHVARRNLGPRRVPACGGRRHDPAAGAGRERARADRPGRGAGALRRRSRAGAGLHRAARRPVGQDPRRPRRRREDGSRAPRASTRASTRCSPRDASPRRRRRSASIGTSRRSTRRRPLPPLPDREPDWRAGAAAAEELGLGRLAGRLEEAASS